MLKAMETITSFTRIDKKLLDNTKNWDDTVYATGSVNMTTVVM